MIEVRVEELLTVTSGDESPRQRDPALIEEIAGMRPFCREIQYFILHTYVTRTVLTFWWTTAILIWLANYPNAIILSILAWTINWLVDLQMGKKSPRSGSGLWSRPQQDGFSDLRCTAPTPASMLFGHAPLAVYQHEYDILPRSACRINDQQTCGKKKHQGGTQSM